ncbi:glycoside hydrolase family 38 C-terminal domain-containing protein [Agriterribacter sp.]|uniref:glycoside hydrolase family 38 C-terminal domain-containing protein n=1 Tax=Agriterribacter sp. TaxID=2821509 RepID=UPI002BAB6E69|nr:glycoside hydrolase family 38 C-terminal domain-containing protein [Agriterribacter sp.]HTN08718.1 glycoside hydrolase family 38 C-terminal domain-containing protein [Agriterribacter sp.]
MYDDALAPATDKSDGALGPAGGPSAGGVAVFNTNSWNHGGLITLNKLESSWGDKVTDELGAEMPSQRLSTGELVFWAGGIPALASKHFRVVKGNSNVTSVCKVNQTTLENGLLKVTVNAATGNITQLINLKTGYNYADEKTNGLNAFYWLPANIDAPVADSNIKVTVTENGPLLVEMKIQSQGRGVRSVSRVIRLVAGQPWVEIKNTVDKLPLPAKDGIHFGFGFNIPHAKTRVDIPWGVMEIDKDQWPQGNRNWIALQRWLDVSNDKQGVTWCSLDAPLFEYGKMTANIALGWGSKGPWVQKTEPSSSVYSWVMNNHWHTNFPLTQEGPVDFRYRIMPHGTYDAAAANRFGMEQAQPLVHVMANKDPKLSPFVNIDNDKVVVTILKSTDESKAVILRLRSLSDKAETVKLDFSTSNPKAVYQCDTEENPGKQIIEDISLLPFGMSTIKVEF